MKSKLKRLLSSVLALAMVFSTFGIVVSADTTATLTATEADTGKTSTTGGYKIYKMTFKLTAPEAIKSVSMIFSYNDEAIQPVKKSGGYPDVDLTQDAKSPFSWYIKSYMDEDTGMPVVEEQLSSPSDPMIIKKDGRTGIRIEGFSTDAIDMSAGKNVFTFYYRILDENKMNNETFKFEKDYTDGSILKTIYPNASEAQTILVDSYKYGAQVGEDSIAVSWKYTNSDKEPVAAKTQVDVSEVEIADVTKTYDGTAATATIEVPAGVKATIAYEGGVAPVNAGTYTATATLTAEEGYELTGVENADLEATITISPKPVTFIVADVTKKANEATVFDGAFAEGDIVDGAEYTVVYSVDENNVISAVVTISDNYAVTYKTGTLTINAAKEDLPVVEGLSELKINGKIYKDLYKVNATIKEGFVGKTILNYGVKFRAMKDEEKVAGGADAVFTPGTEMVLDDAGLTFSAAVIGVPDGITVVAIPFVEFK